MVELSSKSGESGRILMRVHSYIREIYHGKRKKSTRISTIFGNFLTAAVIHANPADDRKRKVFFPKKV